MKSGGASMIGREYKSEKRVYKDGKTGREVCQLTNQGNNYHLYFTDNSFSLGDQEIYFLSDRSSPDASIFNVFKMDLCSGIMTQLTDEPLGLNHRMTKTPDSEFIIYITGNQVKKLNTRTGQVETLYEGDKRFVMRTPFISPDKKYFGLIRNELPSRFEHGPNYKGFKQTMFSVKLAYITLVYMDGSKAFDVFEDTHYLSHFQFAPDDSTLALFCHEGPWHLVHQRMWLLDLISRMVKPCFLQQETDCVGHEFWTRDGLIFFDNRCEGHDGTITSDKSQAIIEETGAGELPYVGLINRNNEMVRRIDMPYYCNHYHATADLRFLVGDTAEDLVLIDISKDIPQIQTLCIHQTSWLTPQTHCHPTFGWNNRKILFESDCEDRQNLYLLDRSQ
jgi:oligogalacturonide lyase